MNVEDKKIGWRKKKQNKRERKHQIQTRKIIWDLIPNMS